MRARRLYVASAALFPLAAVAWFLTPRSAYVGGLFVVLAALFVILAAQGRTPS